MEECTNGAQVIVESRAECEEAQRLIAHIREAYPEVLTAIKTKQLAQEMLLYKDDHIGDVARTGAHAFLACMHARIAACSHIVIYSVWFCVSLLLSIPVSAEDCEGRCAAFHALAFWPG